MLYCSILCYLVLYLQYIVLSCVVLQVIYLQQAIHRVLAVTHSYAELPPIVAQVKVVVKKVEKLFADVKKDVMKFYQVSGIASSRSLCIRRISLVCKGELF